jgi:uncharacterized protein (DUF1684 family)
MSGYLELLDWRRRVHALYGVARGLLPDDPPAAHRRWMAGRDELFAGHPQSPLDPDQRAGFHGLPYWPYDPTLAFVAAPDTDVEPERYEVGTPGGATMAFVRFGVIELPVGRLDVFWLDAYGGGVFLPFRDTTAGQKTYGGGRYLLDTVKGADLGSSPDGSLVCDFNFAYHPSCHYNASWSCPLAPPGNRLEVPVEAGELAAFA